MGDTSEENVSDTSVKDTSPLIAVTAIVILIGLAIFIIYMLRHISAGETEWTRYVYLLTGVEAVGFAAAGYLFGKDVNRVRAEKAEARAVSAQLSANNAQKRAVEAETKGQDLTSLIQTKAKMLNDGSRAKFFTKSESSSDYTISVKNSLDELADYAAKQFPEQNNEFP